VNAPFPLSKSKKSGYNRKQVDDFLERARRSYDGVADGDAHVSSADLRRVSFDLQRGGYQVRFVDAALDRLEDVFFERERRDALRTYGDEAWMNALRVQVNELRNRLEAERGYRFKRAGVFTAGYNRSEVDLFLDRIMLFLNGHASLTAIEVRDTVFTAQNRGYVEDQVDAFLDAVVSFILASR
jgi:DivIVA domain-containing protein